MSSQQKPGQKRKAGDQGGQAKKQNQGGQQQQAKPQQQQQQQAKKQPQSQQPQQGKPAQAKKPQTQQQQGQQKKPQAKKQPEPEPEEEDEEDDGEDDEEGGERDEEALAAIEKVQPAMDAIAAELDAQDAQMNAEIYAVQRKHLLAKRPMLKKRDQLLGGVKGLWKRLFAEHLTFASQMEEIDHELLDALTVVEEQQDFAPTDAEKQQIAGVTVYFTFTASKHTKAGRFAKVFKFDDEKEVMTCVPAKDTPFTSKDAFAKANADSFFLNWFASEGVDDGVLAAQDALSTELYVDPLQLFAHLADGNPMPSMNDSDSDDDGHGDAMMFDDEDDGDEAPELADD